MILYQDCSSHLDSSKNMAARGRGLFSLYIYIENFKNLLVRNHWTNFNIFLRKCSFGDPLIRLFNITWQECFFVDPLPRFVQSVMICQKNMDARVWGIFSLYIYTENFKSLLLRNCWIEFNVTWQECCFGDLLPRLFRPS